MSAEEYDPSFPTETEACKSSKESQLGNGCKYKKKPDAKYLKQADICDTQYPSDLLSIPLPGAPATDENYGVTTSGNNSQVDDKYQSSLTTPSVSDSSAKESSSDVSVNVSAAPEAVTMHENKNTKTSPLSKIQLLIKQKSEQLKGSMILDNKPAKAKNLSLAFGVGKSKSKPTDKVKFSVIKLDRKVTLFSDDEEVSPIISISPNKAKVSGIPSSLSQSSASLELKEASTHTARNDKERLTISPVKTRFHIPPKSDISPSSKSRTSLTTSIPTTTKQSPGKELILGKDLDVVQPQSSVEKDMIIEQVVAGGVEKVTSPTVSELFPNALSLAPKEAVFSEDSPKKSLILHSPPIGPLQSTVRPYTASTVFEDSQSANMVSDVKRDFVQFEKNVKSCDSLSTTKLSYEADSTIPDENMPNACDKSLTLYSDEDSADEHLDAGKNDKSQVQGVTQSNVCTSMSAEHYSDEESLADGHSIPSDNKSLVPSIAQSDDVCGSKSSKLELEEPARGSKFIPQNVTPDDNVWTTEQSIVACQSPSKSDVHDVNGKAGDVETFAFSAMESASASSTRNVALQLHDSQSAIDDFAEGWSKRSKTPQPVLPPDISSASVLPKPPNVKELTAVAKQLLEALTKRIQPQPTSHKSKTPSVQDENNVSSSGYHTHSKPSSHSKRSRSRSASQDIKSRSNKRRSLERSNGRSTNRHRKSKSRDRERHRRCSRSRHRRDRSRSQHRDWSSSGARNVRRRDRPSRSPDRRRHAKDTSLSPEPRRLSCSTDEASTRRSISPRQHLTRSVADKPSSSSITSQVIAENLALISASQPLTSSALLQYVYTSNGQMCQIAPYAPPVTTTQIIDGPPPPPPGVAPPPLPRSTTLHLGTAPPPLPPVAPSLPPVPANFSTGAFHLSGNQFAPTNQGQLCSTPSSDYLQTTYAPHMPLTNAAEQMSSHYMGMQSHQPPQQLSHLPPQQPAHQLPHHPLQQPPYQLPHQLPHQAPHQPHQPLQHPPQQLPHQPLQQMPTQSTQQSHQIPLNIQQTAPIQQQLFRPVVIPKQQGPPPPPPGFNAFTTNLRAQPGHPPLISPPIQALSKPTVMHDNPTNDTKARPIQPLLSPGFKRGNSLPKVDGVTTEVVTTSVCSTTTVGDRVSTNSDYFITTANTPVKDITTKATEKLTPDSSETSSRRRSNRIQRKESRVIAESRIKSEKQLKEARDTSNADLSKTTDEEMVDFVIENRSSKKTIDLPDRSECQQTSPTKAQSTPAAAPGKLKMRWLQASKWQENTDGDTDQHGSLKTASSDEGDKEAKQGNKTEAEPAHFERIDDNIYLTTSKKAIKSQKEAKRMVCDCSTSEEERANNIPACGDDCLNRMLMIECTSRCPCGEFCTNKRFERHSNADVEVVLTEKKGHGLRAKKALPKGTFIREYVGEVLGYKDFKHQVKQYAKDQHKHYYFMALNADEVIDATGKGNISRFINHSCDPNAETEKWTVNGKLRIGFFTIKDISENEEITFDYQFERYGKEAQKCFCGSSNCRGIIGGAKSQPLRNMLDSKSLSGKKKKDEKKKHDYSFTDDMISSEIEKLASLGGLKRSQHVLQLSRLMVRAESIEHRILLVDTLLDTTNHSCLRLFLSYHGLSLLWSWLVALPNIGCYELKIMIINLLRRLPITNKNIIQETKVLPVLERMAKEGKERLDMLSAELNNKQEKQVPEMKPAISEGDFQCKSESVTPDTKEFTTFKPTPLLETKVTDNCDVNKESKDDTGQASSVTENTNTLTSSCQPSVQIAEGQSQTLVKSEPDDTISTPQLQRQSSDQNDEIEHKSSVDGDSQDGSQYHDGCQSQDEQSLDETTKTEDEGNEMEDLGHMVSLIEELLEEWSQLKEEFKIPKKQENEERKRTVQEIDTSRQDDSDKKEKKDLNSYGGRYKRRKRDNPKGQLYDKQEAKQMLLNKLERRRMFEEQVKAEEQERAEEQVRAEEHYEFRQQQQFVKSHVLEAYEDDISQPPPMPEQSFTTQMQTAAIHQSQLIQHNFPGQYPMQSMETAQYALPAMEAPHFSVQPMDVPQFPGQPMEAQYPLQQMGYVQPVPTSAQPVAPVITNSVPLPSQPPALCYYTTPQGMVVQQIVQATPQQPNPSVIYMTSAPSSQTVRTEEPPPPPAERKGNLPSDWRSATDSQGRIYYYHKVTRQTQWEVPTGNEELGSAMEIDSPSREKKSKSKHKKTTMALADTSADAKKMKEHFKSAISVHIRALLNGYMKSDCKVGKITNKEDYKSLAKKLTHAVLDKELKHCRHHEDLEVNDNVKFKAKEFVRKYMAKSGSVYKREKEDK